MPSCCLFFVVVGFVVFCCSDVHFSAVHDVLCETVSREGAFGLVSTVATVGLVIFSWMQNVVVVALQYAVHVWHA